MGRDNAGHIRNEWTINISLDGHDGQSRATALLRGREEEAIGVGVSRLKTEDHFVATIGGELAVARALSDLARKLLAAAARDIETVMTRRDDIVPAETGAEGWSTATTWA